jgi:hypothetical protein
MNTTATLAALARRAGSIIAECNHAQRRLTALHTVPDSYLPAPGSQRGALAIRPAGSAKAPRCRLTRPRATSSPRRAERTGDCHEHPHGRPVPVPEPGNQDRPQDKSAAKSTR